MNTRKLEIWFVVFFLILCGIGWFSSDLSVRNELEKLLITEDRNFQRIEFKQLKISMEKELIRRASYYFYMGKIRDFNFHIKDRYQASKVNLILMKSNEMLEAFDELGWNWYGEPNNMYLKGVNCNQDFCLDIEIPWTRTWLTDSSASLVKQLSEMRFLGWSVLLESPELETPKVVKEYFKMADKLEYLKIGNQIFYGSKLGPSKFNLHRLTVVNTEKLRAKVFEHFIGWFWLIITLLSSTYLTLYFWNHQLSSTYRILVAILLLILLPGIFLSFQSPALLKEQEKQIRHQREIEVINRRALSVIKPSYEKVRHLLPFQDGGIYYVDNGADLLLFTATLGELRGKYFSNLRGSKIEELFALLLLFVISIFGYMWLFRDSGKFWRQLNSRLEQQIGDGNSWSIPEVPSRSVVYDHWDIWRLQLEAEKDIQTRTLQQRLVGFEFEKLLESSSGSNSASFPKELQCVVVCVAPSNPKNLEGQPARDYFDDMNRFLEIFRNTCVKYGGVPFLDAHWHQKAFFSLKRDFLSRQRAILFGLDFVKRLKELDLPSGVSYGAIAKSGHLDLTKVGKGLKHEVLVKGIVLQECDEAMKLFDPFQGFWIHDEMMTESLRGSFDLALKRNGVWNEVTGVKNVGDHLSLLDFSSSELQRTALELLSFQTDYAVLDKVLEKIPSLEPEVIDQAVAIICDYLNDESSRSKIFEKILNWSKQGYDETTLRILSVFHKQTLSLRKSEIDCLLKLMKPINQEIVLSLILENSSSEYLDELDFHIKHSSALVKSRWALIKFQEKPSVEYLIELYDYLVESDDIFLPEILRVWGELKVDKKSLTGECFINWYQQNSENFLARILALIESENMSIRLKSLSVVSHLKLSDTEPELVRIYNLSREPEFKSEIIFTLQNLGSSSYLLQNMI